MINFPEEFEAGVEYFLFDADFHKERNGSLALLARRHF